MVAIHKGLIGLIGLLMITIWLQVLFIPHVLEHQFFIAAKIPEGLSAFRADFGGFFLGVGIFSIWGLRAGQARWLLAAMVLVTGAAIGRLVGMIIDGVNTIAVGSMAFEMIIAVLYFSAYHCLSGVDQAVPPP